MRVAYSTRQAANVLKMQEFRIRNYARAAGLGNRGSTDKAALRFDFRDLLTLRACRRLEAEGLSHPRVCRALINLRASVGANHPSTFLLERHGGSIVARGSDVVWSLETGQGELPLRPPPPAAPPPTADEPPRSNVVNLAGPGAPGADDWFELGVSLEESEPDRAYHAYQQALSCDPEHPAAMINAGRLCAAAGDATRAAGYFRLAIRVDPAQPVAHFNLGVTLHDAADVLGAIKAYRTALIHDPDFADAHYNLAALLEQQGDRQGALQHMRAYKVATERRT